MNLTEDEKDELEKILVPGVQKNQSIHHIVVTSKNQINVSEKSVYRYINAGLFAKIIRLDLPRAVSMKPRKTKYPEHKVDTKCRQNRTYADYQNYMLSHPEAAVVEMDSVLGKRTGKVLLTMQFVSCSFMLAFIRENNTAQSVIDVFNDLEKKFGLRVFRQLFPVILTDNGPEFSNPDALEFSPFTKEQRTKIFYCDPYSSFQKGHIENNHLNLRKIFPKGESMEAFSQADVNLALSHLNSFARESLNNIPAFTLFLTMYGKEITDKLNIFPIESDDNVREIAHILGIMT